MVKALEFFYTVVVYGVGGLLALLFLWVMFSMMVNFWKIYVYGPKLKKFAIQKKCKHSSCCFEPDSELWICNDCGKNFI